MATEQGTCTASSAKSTLETIVFKQPAGRFHTCSHSGYEKHVEQVVRGS